MSKIDSEKMYALAKEMRLKAYAPYSKFLVGACLYTDKGNYYAGCNVENASFRMTDCAETVAVGNMVTESVQKIKAVLVVADLPDGVSPCGSCLQKLSEFIDSDTMVYCANLNKITRSGKFSEFLPSAFGNEFTQLQGS